MGPAQIKLTSENLHEFLSYYHGLHDAMPKSIEYNIADSTATLKLEIFWAGEPKLSNDNRHYEGTRKKNMTLFFDGVIRFNFVEIDSADFIFDVLFRFVESNGTKGAYWQDKSVIVFAIGADFDCDKYVFGVSTPSMQDFIVSENAYYSVE
jgi:hypothetical protein